MRSAEKRYYNYETMPMGSGELSPIRNHHLEKCIEFLSEVERGKVLEAGCGGGQFVRLLSSIRKEFDYFGTDISKKAVSVASNKDNRIRYCVADLAYMPFKQKSFDVIIAFDVFEHIHDFKKAISNIYFSLRDKGIMVTYVPCEGEPFTLYWFFSKINIWKGLQKKHFGHIQSFKKAEIEGLLKENGFRIIKKKYADHLISQIVSFFIWVMPKEMISWFGNRAVEAGVENFELIETNINFNLKQKIIIFIKKAWLKCVHLPLSYFLYYQNSLLDEKRFTARGLFIKCIKN